MLSPMAGTMPPKVPTKPDRAAFLAAAGGRVPDLIEPGLRVLFCGINPGLYSAATRHHFARPGNRFWPALHAGGFTARIVAPWEEGELLELGLGITNLVARATATARGAVTRGAGRGPAPPGAESRPVSARVGRGPRRGSLSGGISPTQGRPRPPAGAGRLSPDSGCSPIPADLNAHHQPRDLAAAFAELRRASIR
jgi:TDG/mug DNA glycosylase family protein